VKIAVSGATGFIGRHILAALAGRPGVEVTALVRRPTTMLPASVGQAVIDLAGADDDVFARAGAPDLLIHLAWGGLPNYRSRHHFENELPIQYRFLKAMVAGGLRSMLVTGTCYEYGMIDGELAENLAPAPANPYAYAKVALHRQLLFLRAEMPFSLSWARLFYMFGPGQAPTSLYSLLQAAIDRGDARFPMSAGEQLRDYLPVERVAELLVELAMRAPDAGIVNICSGVPVSVRSLVEHWATARNSAIVPELGRYSYPDHEPMAFWGSAARRIAILGEPDIG
jgi:dTDP-6-deoxy-L-talose 4-dehydrogenase (NAD+)